LLSARRRLDPAARTKAGRQICAAILAAPELTAARTVAAYVSVGAEPPTAPLLDALHGRGITVLLPVLLGDNDLDWARYDGALGTGRRGLREPAGPRLGVAAIATAEVVVVPALAADRHGHRLGRGGGSYDRALARVGPTAWTVALLYDTELLDAVPTQPHDRPIAMVVTPSGISRPGPGSAAR
jgi:5-formyltetrahydrofolate cyclo-ligase